MIQELLQLMIAQLTAGMAGEVTSPATRFVVGPVDVPALNARPIWALEAGALEVLQAAGDDATGQPRPLEARERLPVNGGTPQGPYVLGNPPLAGSVGVKVVHDEGLVTEYSETLLPGTDFTVDIPTQAVTLVPDIAAASALRITYSYVGNASVKEFEQQLQVCLYVDGWADADRLMGLPAAIIQSQQASLLEQFNFQTPTSFSANSYTCQAYIQKIKLLRFEPVARVPEQAAGDVAVAMRYQVSGQMRLGQSLSGGFGLIQSIHTRGASGPGINIVPGLG